jgi:peptidoglycan hydrolase CwlO-like protein
MEAQKQIRCHQEDIRLTRLANTSLSRDIDAITAQLNSVQGSLDAVIDEREELKAQVLKWHQEIVEPV